MRYWQTLIGTGLVVAVAGVALAQQPPVRVRGVIEKVDGNTLTVKARDGAMLTTIGSMPKRVLRI